MTIPVPPEDVAATLAAQQDAAGVGTGETSVDAAALLAMIKGMQAQIDALNAEKSAATAQPVLGTAEAIRDLLVLHADAGASAIADDLVAAAQSAVESGDGGYVEQIRRKLVKYLTRNAPVPGENYAYGHALDMASNHLSDALDDLEPAAGAGALVPAGTVVPGTVVG